jgi:mono/diheme cytochrome c family protein
MKILRYGAAALGLVVIGLIGAVQLRWDRTFDAPTTNLKASTDSGVIARGRYLAHGPAHCADCHTPPDLLERRLAGEQLPLAGGYEFEIPPGKFRAPNITPDQETGIGRYSDEQIARMIRYGVRHDGRAAIPFMEFQKLADEDVVALISFLRAQTAVRNDVPDHDINFMGRAIMAFLIKPPALQGTPPVQAPSGVTEERGGYLARGVADCVGCHTKRSMLDGSYTGPDFAGGTAMDDETKNGGKFVPPNLTPDAGTGYITKWTEDQFVARFQAGRVYKGSPMPWDAFKAMSEDDLRALYRYLRSLPAVKNDPGAPVQPAKR